MYVVIEIIGLADVCIPQTIQWITLWNFNDATTTVER